MPAVIALAARHIRADDHAIPLAERHALKVRVLSIPTNRRDRSDILMSLNDRKFERAAAVLRGVTLKRVLVRSADPGHFDANQHTTNSRFRQRVFAYLVLPGFY